MSGKNQFPLNFTWQSTDPRTGFFPLTAQGYANGSPASGTATGTMTGTNVIYSQIVDVSKMDNIGLDVDWTGTAHGTFEVLESATGANFHPVTFSPALAQPNGSAGGYGVSINQFPWKYLMLRYTNASGSGTITASGQSKDLN